MAIATSPAVNGVNGTSEESATKTIGETNGVVDGDSTKPDGTDKEDKQKCEVRSYEARYTANGKRELIAVDATPEVDSEDEKARYALCSYKYFDQTGNFESGSVEVRSPHIILALQDIIGSYPGVHFYGSSISIDHPYRCVFHYRKELYKHIESLDEGEAKSHISLLLQFMERELRHSISQYRSSVEDATEDPSISYRNLWMVFKPGDLVLTGSGASQQLVEITDSYERGGNCAAYIIQGKVFTHDGDNFGYKPERIPIGPFKGTKPLSRLSAIPHDYVTNAKAITEKLIQRGRTLVSLKGSHYRAYSGVASALANVRDWDYNGLYKEEPMVIESRIMVDAKMFNIVKSCNRIHLNQIKHIPKDLSEAEIENYLTERDYSICDYRVPGYALSAKRWCWFNIDAIKPVVFNRGAFDSLLLPTQHKRLVHSLVKNHASGEDEFDDMIAGKGKGLVFILHGVPGVGKTFTAESVADHIERPLYILNSGELGITPETVEENLSRALMLATSWNAILLIDEADVFLEERSINDLNRNCLVSLFLRMLEYYEGILFLTTNRITTFDPAFRSRVHLALKYQALSTESRKELWRSFIARTSKAAPVFEDQVLERLAAVDVNGRQIKNAVRTASALARSAGETLSEEHLMGVVETIRDFERDFKGEEG